jgi:hypothetical protein
MVVCFHKKSSHVSGQRRAANTLVEQGSISQRGAWEDCWRRFVTVVRLQQASSHGLFFPEYAFGRPATLAIVTNLFVIQWL